LKTKVHLGKKDRGEQTEATGGSLHDYVSLRLGVNTNLTGYFTQRRKGAKRRKS